ncbi:MAG: SAM-dependent chlorinase/fluorinase [Chitinophagales bacterium]|nr:SAM-dependent chlorinase/fluorinase [Chitinophagaceae bacterium]MCB9065542.1 SAM-dependent chlorinase/fluorinase [Chitinophagales bacterium]
MQDASLASVKGILSQRQPNKMLIDVAHNIEPFHMQQAAYLLASAHPSFEKGTYHIVLFDIFHQREPNLIVAEKDGHYFFAPDNGVLPMAFNDDITNIWLCKTMDKSNSAKDWADEIASAIETISEGGIENAGYEKHDIKNAPKHTKPTVTGNMIECQVIHIDRFENVILNITKQEFDDVAKGRSFSIRFMRDDEINHISEHYYDVNEGQKLCRFNSTGYLEIAINRGKAASLFGFKLLREQQLIYNTIKITFNDSTDSANVF